METYLYIVDELGKMAFLARQFGSTMIEFFGRPTISLATIHNRQRVYRSDQA